MYFAVTVSVPVVAGAVAALTVGGVAAPSGALTLVCSPLP